MQRSIPDAFQSPMSDFRDPLSERVRQLETRLFIATQTYDRAIDSLNNKVASLENAIDGLKKALETSEGFNAVKMDKTRVDATLRVGLDMPKISFGVEVWTNLTNPVVTVTAGDIRIGDNVAIGISDTDVEITADNTYVYLEYDYGDNTLTVQASTTKPASTGEYFRKWLCLVKKSGANGSITKWGYLGGDIDIPAIYKPDGA